jgi:hypothetical protein
MIAASTYPAVPLIAAPLGSEDKSIIKAEETREDGGAAGNNRLRMGICRQT